MTPLRTRVHPRLDESFFTELYTAIGRCHALHALNQLAITQSYVDTLMKMTPMHSIERCNVEDLTHEPVPEELESGDRINGQSEAKRAMKDGSIEF